MKRWFLLAAMTVAVPIVALACGSDDRSGATPPPTATIDDAGKPTPTSTATSTAPVDAGHRTGCLDRPTDVERPERLPCNLIPPGLTL